MSVASLGSRLVPRADTALVAALRADLEAADLTVVAVEDGKQAAESIHRALSGGA